jgi:YHS domain-containing protein
MKGPLPRGFAKVCHLGTARSRISWREFDTREKDEAMEIDPVCGMEVDPATAEWTWDYEGEKYYFCAKGCMEDFMEDPGSYLG